MYKLLILLIISICLFSSNAFAYTRGSHPSTSGQYSQDAYGHWTRNDNLYNDSDGDGVSNYYDRNDNNPYKH